MRNIIFIFLLNIVVPAYCGTWKDLWVNKDFFAQHMMDQHNFTQAFDNFERTDWKAVAAYRAQRYQDAAKLFAELNTADGYYNQGNALALQGQYQPAVDAYTHVLSLDPQHVDAAYNLELVKKLLKQQKSQDSQSKQSDSKQQATPKPQDQKDAPPKKAQKDTAAQQETPKSRDQEEKDHEKEQWLSLIPDDPGAFLRMKFLRDYLGAHQS